jgi:hypothetical protein
MHVEDLHILRESVRSAVRVPGNKDVIRRTFSTTIGEANFVVNECCSKIKAEEAHSLLRSGTVTTAGLEKDVRTGREPEIAFDQFAAHDVNLFSGSIVFIDIRPFSAGQNVDDPNSDARGTWQISAVATVSHCNGCHIIDLYRLENVGETVSD